MTAFFTAYFLLLKLPQFPVTEMPVTAVDRLIGFHPLSLLLYVSLWPYVSLAPMLLYRREQLVDYFIAAIAMSIAGMVCFLFWPTASPPPPGLDRGGAGFGMLQSVDAAGNACPSLHVAFSVFTAIWFDALLQRLGDRGRWRVASFLLCVGIAWSTLGAKQHVMVDVLAGAGLGLVTGVLLRRRLASRPFPLPFDQRISS